VSEQSIWKKEISFRRKPAAKPSVPESGPGEALPGTPQVPPAQNEEPKKTPFWKKEITLGRKQAEPAVESPRENVAPEPQQLFETPRLSAAPAEAAPGEVPAVEPWAEVAPGGEVPAVEPWAEAARGGEVPAAEPWATPAALPDAPTEEPQTAVAHLPAASGFTPPPPLPGVHPPVPASELPSLPEEATKAPKQSIFKRELSFRRKRDETEPKERRLKRAKRSGGANAGAPKRHKQLVGLKVGASQLAAARIVNNGFPEVVQIAREPLQPGIVVGGELREPDALALALKAFFRKHKLPMRNVRLGIANNRIGVRTFEIGGVDDPKQLANAIRFRAQEALPIPIEDAVLDHQILSEAVDPEGALVRRVLLVVAYRDLIDRYMVACKKAGLGLVGIDLEAFALLRAVSAPDGRGDDAVHAGAPTGAVVAVSIGHERSTLAVSDGRVCEFTRVLDWGGSALNVAVARVLDVAPSAATPVKHALSLYDGPPVEGLSDEQTAKARDAVREQLQVFARELVSSLHFYQNQPGSLGIGEIVLTGGTTHLPGIEREIERLVGVPVRVADPLERVKVGKKVRSEDQIGSLTIAIGLGIED
jgi:type IV pilus assembly protein PilM